MPQSPLLPPLDIFRVADDGQLLWRTTADSNESAARRVKMLMISEPGDYVICSQQTGDKAVIRSEELG
jgi:hypothetical protein